MRFSFSNFVAAATAAGALLLAACAGHGMVPAGNSFGPSAVSPDAVAPDAKATANPCLKTQTPWVFGGTCGTVKLTSTGGVAKMSGYEGFGIQATFSSGAKAGTVLMVRDAIGKGDATGKVKNPSTGTLQFFPHFTQIGNNKPYITVTPILYIKVQNLGATFNFNNVPAIQVTSAKAYPGNRCVETRMQTTNNTWQMSPVNAGTITGHTVKFPSVITTIPFPAHSEIYIAIACYTQH